MGGGKILVRLAQLGATEGVSCILHGIRLTILCRVLPISSILGVLHNDNNFRYGSSEDFWRKGGKS